VQTPGRQKMKMAAQYQGQQKMKWAAQTTNLTNETGTNTKGGLNNEIK